LLITINLQTKMKKVFSVLAFASALAFAACGGEKHAEPAEQPANMDTMMNEMPAEEPAAPDSSAMATPAEAAPATEAPAAH
jgi:hypothetical protein